MPEAALSIAMLSIHSSPLGRLGTRDTGGMSVYVRALARELGRRGHRVDIFTRRQADEPAMTRLDPGVRLITLTIRQDGPLTKHELYPYASDFSSAAASFARQENSGYDLIHSHYWLSGQVGRRLQQAWQRPHVISFHTLAALKANSGSAAPAQRLAVEKALVRECNLLLAPCVTEKGNLVHHYGAQAARIAMVPGGVDFDLFRPLDAAAARRQLGIEPDAFLLLMIGRLTPLKGQARVIDALAQVDSDPRLQLMIVGGDGPRDPELRRLQQRVDAAGLERRVIFTGSVTQEALPAHYAAADVYVLASQYESFGLVGLEALACGRPVVTSPVGIMASLAGEQRPGVIMTDGSPAGLAAGVAALREGTVAWSPETIRDAVRDFSWERAAEAALSTYRRVLSPSHGPAN
ncbi:MAG: glycosyltransferase [Desulfosarcinaceae bacterium]|nr:glycosyltransferase [Desulfosarcinaceae bacterium]